MTIEFSPNANKSNTAGATAPAAKSAPTAPNQLMTLGAPPPLDFAAQAKGWMEIIRAFFAPQAVIEDGKTEGAHVETEDEDGARKSDESSDITAKVAAPDIRNGVEFKEDAKFLGKKSEQGDFYGKPVDPDHALA